MCSGYRGMAGSVTVASCPEPPWALAAEGPKEEEAAASDRTSVALGTGAHRAALDGGGASGGGGGSGEWRRQRRRRQRLEMAAASPSTPGGRRGLGRSPPPRLRGPTLAAASRQRPHRTSAISPSFRPEDSPTKNSGNRSHFRKMSLEIVSTTLVHTCILYIHVSHVPRTSSAAGASAAG
jgi:hypothetical protein